MHRIFKLLDPEKVGLRFEEEIAVRYPGILAMTRSIHSLPKTVMVLMKAPLVLKFIGSGMKYYL
jgi:hypothetical protein